MSSESSNSLDIIEEKKERDIQYSMRLSEIKGDGNRACEMKRDVAPGV